MIDPATIQGKRLAMIAWGKKSDGSDDVAVLFGIAEWDGTALNPPTKARLYLFRSTR